MIRCNICDQPVAHEIVCEDCLVDRGLVAAVDPAQGWRDIETAPKDEPILVAHDVVRRGWFSTHWGKWFIEGEMVHVSPIYWMPLPPVPVRASDPRQETP